MVVLDVTTHVNVVVGGDTIVVVVLADSVLNFASVVVGVAAVVDDEVVNVSAVVVKVILQIIVIKPVK